MCKFQSRDFKANWSLVGKIKGPQDVLISVTCEYATMEQRANKAVDGSEIDNQLALKEWDYPRLFQWSNVNYRVFMEEGGSRSLVFA